MYSTSFNNRLAALLSNPFELVRRDIEDGNGNSQRRVGAPLALWEDDQKVVLEIDAPGIQRESLDLTFENGTLHIRGERKTPQCEGKCWHDERRYGTFERTVRFDDTLDTGSMEAALVDGVLQVTLAKKPEAKPHKIVVKSANSDESK